MSIDGFSELTHQTKFLWKFVEKCLALAVFFLQFIFTSNALLMIIHAFLFRICSCYYMDTIVVKLVPITLVLFVAIIFYRNFPLHTTHAAMY